MTTKSLAPQESQLATVQEPSVALMLGSFIERGITAENVAAFAQLIELKERVDRRDAEKAFTVDMVRLKQTLSKSPVKATKMVPNNDGTARYHFAPLEEIDSKLAPIALEHGFTYSFSEGPAEPGKVTKVCVVQHIGGHSKSNPYTVRVAPVPKATDTQNDGAAHSYAKRGALCDAFGIIAEKDTDGASDDARNEGHPISTEQAAGLERRCVATKTNRKAFLELAGVDVDKGGSFSDIMSSRFADLDAELSRRERKQQAGEELKKDSDGNFIF